MVVKMEKITFLKFFFLIIILEVTGAQTCLILQSKNIYGDQIPSFDQNSCFEVQISELNEIIVHTNSNLVGFTFNFKDGTTQNFMETSGSSNDFRIDLSTSDLIGCKIYLGEGIEGLEFQLYNWNTNQESLSAILGQSSSCFSFFNSSSLNIKYLKIDSIQGCIDKKGSSYFPFLSFAFSFSQCPFCTSATTLNIDISTVTTEKKTNSTTTLSSETSTLTTEATISSSSVLTSDESTFTTEKKTNSTTTLSRETSTLKNDTTISSSSTLALTSKTSIVTTLTTIFLSSTLKSDSSTLIIKTIISSFTTLPRETSTDTTESTSSSSTTLTTTITTMVTINTSTTAKYTGALLDEYQQCGGF
jgi:hypothetical protein